MHQSLTTIIIHLLSKPTDLDEKMAAGPRHRRAWLRVVALLAGPCLASEQVLLLSEPGSGAHSFAASLASEARALRGHDYLIAWGAYLTRRTSLCPTTMLADTPLALG